MDNIVNHLDNDGLFVGSISMVSDEPLHETIKDKKWWMVKFSNCGLSFVEDEENPFDFFDYCRGISLGKYDSYNYMKNPEKGFHFVAKLKQ